MDDGTIIAAFALLALVIALEAAWGTHHYRRAERAEREAARNDAALKWLGAKHELTLNVTEAAARYLQHIDAESRGAACLEAETRLREALQHWRKEQPRPGPPANVRVN